jgi:ferritin-like protein
MSPRQKTCATQFGLTATSRVATKAKPSVAAAAHCPEALHPDITLPAREQAVYLLHVGAEVEHALMAQYYAAYSLGGSQLSGEQQKLVRQWRDVIVQIAREEMAIGQRWRTF